MSEEFIAFLFKDKAVLEKWSLVRQRAKRYDHLWCREPLIRRHSVTVQKACPQLDRCAKLNSHSVPLL